MELRYSLWASGTTVALDTPTTSGPTAVATPGGHVWRLKSDTPWPSEHDIDQVLAPPSPTAISVVAPEPAAELPESPIALLPPLPPLDLARFLLHPLGEEDHSDDEQLLLLVIALL